MNVCKDFESERLRVVFGVEYLIPQPLSHVLGVVLFVRGRLENDIRCHFSHFGVILGPLKLILAALGVPRASPWPLFTHLLGPHFEANCALVEAKR